MSPQRAFALFVAHKNRAQRQGIGWDFTFKGWLEWWGDDIHRRGRGREQLGMCRHHDRGPYAADNVYKGTPKANAAERGLMERCRRTYLHRPITEQRNGVIGRFGFKSHGSFVPRPDQALEAAQAEHEWVPGD